MAENKGIIYLPRIDTGIDRVKYIWLSYDNIALGGGEFFLAADKFRRAFSDIIYFKLAVPVHRDTVEMVGDNAFIIAERLDVTAVYTIFL